MDAMKKRHRDPSRCFAETLRALTACSGADVYEPYAEAQRTGSIQRDGTAAATLVRIRAERDRSGNRDEPLVPTAWIRSDATPASSSETRSIVDSTFSQIRDVILGDDNLAWDAIDSSTVSDRDQNACFNLIQWLGDCLSIEPRERVDYANDRIPATARQRHKHVGGDAGDRAATSVVDAIWFLERLECGMGQDSVRMRPGLVAPQSETMCIRLAAVAAIKRLAPDLDEVGLLYESESATDAARISRIGRVYRGALRHRLECAYAVYADLADAIDLARQRGDAVPPGPVPTPHSVATWCASRSDTSPPLFRCGSARPGKRARIALVTSNDEDGRDSVGATNASPICGVEPTLSIDVITID